MQQELKTEVSQSIHQVSKDLIETYVHDDKYLN